MLDHLTRLADSFGPWIALCAVLLWHIFWLSKEAITRGYRREQSLIARIESLEGDYRGDLRSALNHAATALDTNSQAFQRIADALHDACTAIHRCPCIPNEISTQLRTTANLNKRHE